MMSQLQRESTPVRPSFAAARAGPLVEAALQSPGRPLDQATQARLGPRFGHDFSRVRVHSDQQAAESARAVDAWAYTVGRHVVFDSRQGGPETSAGQRVLAHELAHVVQQGDGDPKRPTRISQPGDPAEQAAERAAWQAMAGARADAGTAPAPATMLLRYRSKGDFNFGRGDEPGASGLKEEQFTNAKKQPWIEQITITFDGSKQDDNSEVVPTGTLTASYKANDMQLSDVTTPIVGGTPTQGFTTAGTFTVNRIEGFGFNDRRPTDPSTGGAEKEPHEQYSKNPEIASMNYAIFFTKHEAIHAGSLTEGSHACVHVDWSNLHTIRQLNYHSVIGRTKVQVSYDAAVLKAICCPRMQHLHVKHKGDAPNPCNKADPKDCPP